MPSLTVSNQFYNLKGRNCRGFHFSQDFGNTWESHNDNVTVTENDPRIFYSNLCHIVKINGKRIKNSSLAISIKDFPHTIELVDKFRSYVLLRFVPKPKADPTTPEIKIECLTKQLELPIWNTVCKNVANTLYYISEIEFIPNPPKVKRIINVVRTASQGRPYTSNYTYCQTSNSFNVGNILENEMLEIYMSGKRPKKKTEFAISIPELSLKVILTDYNRGNTPDFVPHIEAKIFSCAECPSTVNITIQGDETND